MDFSHKISPLALLTRIDNGMYNREGYNLPSIPKSRGFVVFFHLLKFVFGCYQVSQVDIKVLTLKSFVSDTHATVRAGQKKVEYRTLTGSEV